MRMPEGALWCVLLGYSRHTPLHIPTHGVVRQHSFRRDTRCYWHEDLKAMEVFAG